MEEKHRKRKTSNNGAAASSRVLPEDPHNARVRAEFSALRPRRLANQRDPLGESLIDLVADGMGYGVISNAGQFVEGVCEGLADDLDALYYAVQVSDPVPFPEELLLSALHRLAARARAGSEIYHRMAFAEREAAKVAA